MNLRGSIARDGDRHLVRTRRADHDRRLRRIDGFTGALEDRHDHALARCAQHGVAEVALRRGVAFLRRARLRTAHRRLRLRGAHVALGLRDVGARLRDRAADPARRRRCFRARRIEIGLVERELLARGLDVFLRRDAAREQRLLALQRALVRSNLRLRLAHGVLRGDRIALRRARSGRQRSKPVARDDQLLLRAREHARGNGAAAVLRRRRGRILRRLRGVDRETARVELRERLSGDDAVADVRVEPRHDPRARERQLRVAARRRADAALRANVRDQRAERRRRERNRGRGRRAVGRGRVRGAGRVPAREHDRDHRDERNRDGSENRRGTARHCETSRSSVACACRRS
jgi:hypothetical protein